MIKTVCFLYEGLTKAQSGAIGRVASRRLYERAAVKECPDGYVFCFALNPLFVSESYTISKYSGRDGVRIEGSTMSALLTGFGSVLRDGTLRPDAGFEPGNRYNTHIFPKSFRGIYLATHNHNYYTDAPLCEVRELIEDLTLWGLNVICVWFDMFQHADINDDESRTLLKRLHDIFDICGELGVKTAFTSNSNEAFPDSPEELRAEWMPQGKYFRSIRGHYHVEICPSKPGGLEAILEHRERYLKAIQGFNVDYFISFPYDQGGCTCKACAPWGANGYLRTVNALRPLIKKYLPDTEFCLCAWYFDRFTSDEWQAFLEKAEQGDYNKWAAFCLAFFNTHERIPGELKNGKGVNGIPLVEFTEISMYGAKPWGGFGANPFPQKIEDIFRRNGSIYGGVLPYSEGKYEDINKCVVLGLYSGLYDNSDDIVRDYIRLEYSPDNTRLFMQLIDMEENCLVRTRVDDEVPNPGRSCKVRFAICNNQIQERMKIAAEELNDGLDKASRASWRWQLVYLRAMIDCELVKNNSYMSQQCIEYMDRLVEIYHAQKALYWVSPPTPEALVRNGVLEADDING